MASSQEQHMVSFITSCEAYRHDAARIFQYCALVKSILPSAVGGVGTSSNTRLSPMAKGLRREGTFGATMSPGMSASGPAASVACCQLFVGVLGAITLGHGYELESLVQKGRV